MLKERVWNNLAAPLARRHAAGKFLGEMADLFNIGENVQYWDESMPH